MAHIFWELQNHMHKVLINFFSSTLLPTENIAWRQIVQKQKKKRENQPRVNRINCVITKKLSFKWTLNVDNFGSKANFFFAFIYIYPCLWHLTTEKFNLSTRTHNFCHRHWLRIYRNTITPTKRSKFSQSLKVSQAEIWSKIANFIMYLYKF